MPRGEETQETPQEEGENTRQIKESTSEVQHDSEMATEPAAIVERERPIEESEAIEAELKAAVEAMPLIQAPAIEDGEEISVSPVPTPTDPPLPGIDEVSLLPVPIPNPTDRTESEISATPITLPMEDPDEIRTGADEVSTIPVTQPNEDGEPMAEAREVADSLDETSFKVETRAEGEEVLLAETSFKVESPAPGQVISEGTDSQIEDEILDDISFKFFTPQPDQDLGGSEVPEEKVVSRIETEGEVILEGTAFKPIPAREEIEEIEHEDHWSEPVSEEEGQKEEPDVVVTEFVEEGVEEEGGSILIGEEEVLEQINLTEEATKEVEEYWEPPEMYIYRHEDGSLEFVDKDGNPIKCPPQYFLDKESGSGTAKAWYPGGKNVQAFEVPPFPGYKVDEFYIKEDGIDPVTGKTNYILVDRNGNPIQNQPEITQDVGTGKFTYLGTPEEGHIPVKLFSESEIYLYSAPDGSKTLVDSSGNPVKCPPKVNGDNEVGYFFTGPQGEKIKINPYTSPTTDIYVYTALDGTKTVVDINGNPVKCPPPIYNDPTGEGALTVGSQGEKIIISAYQPPLTGIYVYTAQDGTKTLVDINGNPVQCPPPVFYDSQGDGAKTTGPGGEKIQISAYKPPLTGIYVYIAQDGTKTIVDENGDPVKCPPPVWNDPSGDGAITIGPEGDKMKLSTYQPPVTGIFVYTALDGTKTIVDKYGDPVKCPPPVWNDPEGDGAITVGPQGEKIKLQEYKPISSHWQH